MLPSVKARIDARHIKVGELFRQMTTIKSYIKIFFKQAITPAFLDLFSLRYFNVLNFVDKL